MPLVQLSPYMLYKWKDIGSPHFNGRVLIFPRSLWNPKIWGEYNIGEAEILVRMTGLVPILWLQCQKSRAHLSLAAHGLSYLHYMCPYLAFNILWLNLSSVKGRRALMSADKALLHSYLTSPLSATRVGERRSLHVIKPLVDIRKRSWCERARSISKHNKAQLLLACTCFLC